VTRQITETVTAREYFTRASKHRLNNAHGQTDINQKVARLEEGIQVQRRSAPRFNVHAPRMLETHATADDSCTERRENHRNEDEENIRCLDHGERLASTRCCEVVRGQVAGRRNAPTSRHEPQRAATGSEQSTAVTRGRRSIAECRRHKFSPETFLAKECVVVKI